MLGPILRRCCLLLQHTNLENKIYVPICKTLNPIYYFYGMPNDLLTSLDDDNVESDNAKGGDANNHKYEENP